jgi:release factor glutamine methyltransferase
MSTLPTTMDVREAALWAETKFRNAGIETARLDAELLLAHLLAVERISIILLPHRALSADEDQRFRLMVARRANREPFAYVVGEKEFWSLPFMVTPATLIPRPDSETLIDVAVRNLAFNHPARILDFGTGCGCLLLAALSEFSHATGVGVDQSEAALRIARQNGQTLSLADRVLWLQSDWDAALEADQGFDLILANPPYIGESERDSLEPDVRDYEPAAALFAGQDGLAAYHNLLPAISRRLAPAGIALVEIGRSQADAVTLLAQAAGFRVKVHPDLTGWPRVLGLKSA